LFHHSGVSVNGPDHKTILSDLKKMKNNEIIWIASFVALVAALLYRKYGKKKKAEQKREKINAGRSVFFSQSEAEDYEPYFKKRNQE
jgi:hypothetical protein